MRFRLLIAQRFIQIFCVCFHFSIPLLFRLLICCVPVRNWAAAAETVATRTVTLILKLNRRINWNNDLFLNSCCLAKRNVLCALIKLHSIPSHYFPLFNLVLGCFLLGSFWFHKIHTANVSRRQNICNAWIFIHYSCPDGSTANSKMHGNRNK